MMIKTESFFLLFFLWLSLIFSPVVRSQDLRARDAGVPFEGRSGKWNAITDVAGVTVGHTTLVSGEGVLVKGKGPVRTGVTAILPRGTEFAPVYANFYALNGNGELTGTHWITESGFLETPILITNTGNVGIVRDAAWRWMDKNQFYAPFYKDYWYGYPVVAETYDGMLNDINGQHVKEHHVWQALDNARSGPVEEGSVGGGTGMMCFNFKGGIGTSSRVIDEKMGGYTVGVLVQANFGSRAQLTIAGVPVGKELTDTLRFKMEPFTGAVKRQPEDETGSIIVILATDAPLLPGQLKRLAQRIPLGLTRTGGIGGNGSGDIFLAFSTANKNAFNNENKEEQVRTMPNELMNSLFAATIQATEEAIINALFAGRTMTGINGNTVFGLPRERVIEILKKYNRFSQEKK
jgi:D-aminopeptidase